MDLMTVVFRRSLLASQVWGRALCPVELWTSYSHFHATVTRNSMIWSQSEYSINHHLVSDNCSLGRKIGRLASIVVQFQVE
jgi:hypothetical protein